MLKRTCTHAEALFREGLRVHEDHLLQLRWGVLSLPGGVPSNRCNFTTFTISSVHFVRLLCAAFVKYWSTCSTLFFETTAYQRVEPTYLLQPHVSLILQSALYPGALCFVSAYSRFSPVFVECCEMCEPSFMTSLKDVNDINIYRRETEQVQSLMSKYSTNRPPWWYWLILRL